MQYTDDGITLDYSLLQTCYPTSRGWARFIKNKKANSQDFVYYGRRGANKPFNPPVITGMLNMTNKNLLVPVPDFEEEYKLSNNYQEEPVKELRSHKKETATKEVKKEIKEIKEVKEIVEEENAFDSINFVENSEDIYVEWGGSSEDEGKSEKEANKNGIRRRGIKKETNKDVKDEMKGVDRTKGGAKKRRRTRKVESPSYLENRIPSLWPAFETKNMYEINKLYYMDPVSMLKEVK